MQDDITSQAINAATLAVDTAQLRTIAARMPIESFAFLCNQLFKGKAQHVMIDEDCVICDGPLENGTKIDLLQGLIGPGKLGKPVTCWILEPNGSCWRPISLRKRITTRVTREFHVT